MKNIKFKVTKNIVNLPEVEGVDSFLIEGSKFQDSVSRYEGIYFKAAEYSPGTKVTVDADSFKQITVYAIVDGQKVFLRRAKINAPWTGIFDENHVFSNMFLEQANETTFPKAIIEDEQEEEVDEQVEIEEAIAVADEYKNADENFLQEKTDDELSDIVEKATLINHAELVSKASDEIERRKNADEIEDEQVVETKSQKAHKLVAKLGYGTVWENYDRTRVYFDSKEIVETLRPEIEFFNDWPQKGEVDGRDFNQPDMRKLVNGFDEVFYDFDKDELVIETVNWGAYVNDISDAIAADFKKAVDVVMNPEDAAEALSSDEINETIAGIELEDEQEVIEEEQEVSVDSSKWEEYNAEGRIAILNELHPNITITISEYENDVSLGRGSIISARKVYVNRVHIETSSFDDFYNEFKAVISMKPRKRNTAAFSRKKNEEVDPMREELYARAKKKSEEKDKELEALADSSENDEIEDEQVIEESVAADYDVDPLSLLAEPLEPGTPEYYRHWLLNANTDEIISDLISIVNSLKQGKVRYSELEAVQKELVDRMGGNTDYKFEALVAVLIESRNGSHQEEVEKRVNDIKTQIEEHMEEGRRFQHEYDVFKGVIRPDPLDEILDDVNSTLNEIEEYGDAFMNWINDDQEPQPF